MARNTLPPLRILAAAIALVCASGVAHAGLLIRQQANGLPGLAEGEVAPQRLFVGERAMRLEDLREGGRTVIVRLDEGLIWEIDPTLGMYTEQTFEALRRRREKAERDREEKRRLALERLSGEELESWLRRKGLRRDGKRIVTTEHLGGERVGRWHARHLRITVNDKPAIELWVTDEIPEFEPPAAWFDLYDETGLFPKDVTAALRAVEGFPVRVIAHVDLDTVGATLRSEVESVHDWPERPERFVLPDGLRRVDRFPERSKRSDGEAAEPVRCVQCGKVIENPVERVPGGTGYVCSRRCLIEYIKSLRRRRPPAAGTNHD
ncbi:MAG: DUF4412 domain-containing protein [Planctomycetota bacterium]|nr:MAG: DUF4412 domain-containing protein [Planctomycetota bacterium]